MMMSEKIRPLDCNELSQMLQQIHQGQGIAKEILILDIRPTSQYLQGAIRETVHLCIPSTLLKRKSFTLGNVESTLDCKEKVEKFRNRKSLPVIFVDQEGQNLKKNDPVLITLINKYLDEQSGSENPNIPFYLQGGFELFHQHFGPLCEVPQKGLKVCRLPINESPCPIKTHKTNDEPAKITDYLYLGDQKMASDGNLLEKFNITSVLNTAFEVPNYFEGKPGMHYHKLHLSDSACQLLTPNSLNQAFNFIEQARIEKRRVLVHCQAGQSRSATIVIAYIMNSYHYSLPEAYQRVQASRNCVAPNLGFMAQLTKFEREMSEKRAASPGRIFSPNCLSNSPTFLECLA